jgi:hypothetical protein
MGAHGSTITSTTTSITIRIMLPCMAISGFSLDLLLGGFQRALLDAAPSKQSRRACVSLDAW